MLSYCILQCLIRIPVFCKQWLLVEDGGDCKRCKLTGDLMFSVKVKVAF